MISIKTLLLYVAGVLAIVGVTVVVTNTVNNNTSQTQQAKEAENHEAWRHLMAEGPTDTPPLGAALKNGKTILNDFHATPDKLGEKHEEK